MRAAASISAALVSREMRFVRELETTMRKDFLADYDFDALAVDNGMHQATFRRYWSRLCPLPPARFLMRLRMNEACRMLVESEQTVGEIAYALKFEDPLYFSSKFRHEFGCTATEYRERHQAALRAGR